MDRKNNPLTLEQLKHMDGQTVQYEANGEIFIVDLNNPDFGDCVVNENGYYIPLHRAVDRAIGRRFFKYDRPRIDREKWGPCEYCSGKRVLYQHTNSTKLFVDTFGSARTIVTECNACPPHADCCMNGIPANSAFLINFCPHCGRPLTEEAWAELERRVFGEV